MSDDWDFYFLRVDDKPASIFVDLGIAPEAPIKTLPFMAYVRIYMKNPRSDGLSSQEEFDALVSIEDAIKEVLIGGDGTLYVGRNTGDGVRDFYFYTTQATDWDRRAKALMRSFAAYEFDSGCRGDPEWKTYLEFLYPSDADKERMKNRRLCGALSERGDALTEKREIDHWAYFPSASARSAFIERAAKLGFLLRSTSEPEKPGDRFGAPLFRIDAPAFDAIDDVTLPLFELATALGGDYDGWETMVVT
jgi:hypothetical protein